MRILSRNVLISILSIVIFAVVLIIIANQFIANTYNLRIDEYFQYSSSITKEEAEYMSEKGTLYFSSDKNAPPFAYVEKANGQYKGLVLDYVNALSIELGIDIEFVPQLWEDVISSVTNGNSDMCDVFPSEEREKYLAFSEPIYNLRAITITNSTDITDVDDLSGHAVSIPAGDYAVEFIQKNMPEVKVVETEDLYDALIEFRDGKVDAVIGDEPVLLNFVKELHIDNVYILDSALYDREVCIGVKKTDTMLVNILNKGILNMQKKNSIEKIQQKWFGLSVPISKYKIPEKLLLTINALITTVFLIFIVMSIWSYVLQNEIKKSTDNLNKSKNNLQNTVDALNSFLVCIDEEGCIVSANKSFYDYLKEEGFHIEGKNYKSISILNFIDISQENQSNREFKHDNKYYQYSISELESADYKYLVVIEDITDKKISQKQVLQQNKMIALGQLAAGVAHEIRNPLGLIQNYCYILKTYVLSQDRLAEESIDVIESSVNRVDKIVNNLLEYSRAENDKTSCINLKETLTNIISFDNKLRNRNDIDVSIKCKDNIMFFTKPESISHIILNLLSNSADAMPDGGKISIECETESNYVIIYFRDNGKGISKENIEHIFNPFFSTKNSGEATGLGLYITYNEIRKISGNIQVESEIGCGTMFKLKFPIIEEMCENA